MSPSAPSNRTYSAAALLSFLTLSLALTLWTFYLTGWLAEDAYIVFRVVDNITSGHGPVWNQGERVQVFTSPLWTGLVALFSYLTGAKPPLTALGVSLACNCIVISVAVVVGVRRPIALGLALTCLFCSQSFLDYSSSGLENPLLHALVALLCLVSWFECRLAAFEALAGASFVCALALCTRLDAVFLAAPVLATVVWKRQREVGWRHTALAVVVGMLPFIAWEFFSVIYYGSFVPNTALAKLPLGYPRGELARTGLTLIRATIAQDPGTALSVVVVPIALLLMRTRYWSASLAASAGMMMYIVAVGGDFMLGRFLSALFVLSWLLLLAGVDEIDPSGFFRRRSVRRIAVLLLAFLVAATSLASLSWQYTSLKFSPHFKPQPFYEQQVADERSYYSREQGVRALIAGKTDPWLEIGERMKSWLAGRKALVAKQNVGMFGYTVGPDVHIVDLLTLGDAFLSRLPACPSVRAGHFSRSLPAGYIRSLLQGKNRLQDPLLARLLDDIVLATRASLRAPGRCAAIWRLNSGAYGDAERLGRYAGTPGGVENVGVDQGKESVPCSALKGGGAGTVVLGVSTDTTREPPWAAWEFARNPPAP